jgi:hypothetical protein
MTPLWPPVPPDAHIYGAVSLVILSGPNGKPVIAIELEGQTVYLTATLAELIGGAGQGARLRWEDHQ